MSLVSSCLLLRQTLSFALDSLNSLILYTKDQNKCSFKHSLWFNNDNALFVHISWSGQRKLTPCCSFLVPHATLFLFGLHEEDCANFSLRGGMHSASSVLRGCSCGQKLYAHKSTAERLHARCNSTSYKLSCNSGFHRCLCVR